MTKRPLAVTIISCVYIAAGILGIAYHLSGFRTPHPFHFDPLGIAFIRLLAIVSGIFMLRGRNWARWLALAWMAFHTVLGALHTLPEFLMHALLLAVFGYFLLRPQATNYFRGASAKAQGA